jgi:hypothetical protein
VVRRSEPFPDGLAAWGTGSLVHHRQHLANFHIVAFLVLDARNDAAAVGIDFEIDLLGFEFDDRVADFDTLAFLFQPARHARFDNGFTKLGNDDVGHRSGQTSFDSTIDDSEMVPSMSNAC